MSFFQKFQVYFTNKGNFMTRKNNTDFIKKLKLAMLESGLNQTKLAKKLGLNSSSISGWLLGKNNPKLSTLQDIAKATNKPLNYFFENSFNTTGNNVAGRDNNIHQSTEIETLKKDVLLLKKEVEILKLKINILNRK